MFLKLQSEIKSALLEMKFNEKYKRLVERFDSDKIRPYDRLKHYRVEEVLSIMERLGYGAYYDENEGFFHIKENVDKHLKFHFHISLELGVASIIVVVMYNGKYRLGSPWSLYGKMLRDRTYTVKRPVFREYTELELLLKEVFHMYEEFKKQLIAIY